MLQTRRDRHSSGIDYPTLIMISILAYVVTTAFHEYLGHAVACAILGGTVRELNAFYLDCQYGTISDVRIRLIAVAGPLASFLTGVVSFIFLNKLKKISAHGIYFLWLLGTISLLTATGYLIFSGITGVGDFGLTRDGALFQLSSVWIWRVLITILGLIGYGGVVVYSLRRLHTFLGGEYPEYLFRAKTLTLISYLSGCAMAILIGVLNPLGFHIVLFSSLASTAGGTSALLWMTRFLNREKQTGLPLFEIKRDLRWIGISLVIVVIYAIVFGPSLYL